VELTPTGLHTYHMPLVPDTAHRVHRDKGNTTIVVGYETQHVVFAQQPAALSIKCSFAGPVNYVVDGRRVVVDEDRYLLVNHDHAYSSYVEHEAPVRALSVFFGKPLVDEVVRCLMQTDEALLDNADALLSVTEFFEYLQPYDVELLPHLRAIHQAHDTNAMDAQWLVERLHELLAALVRRERACRVQIAGLPSLRTSTRLEVFRRVSVARDFIDSNFDQTLGLDVIAAQACMSPHHFLRSFKQVVGQTPHQYLMDLRLSKARRLLSVHDLPVATAAGRVGFESWEHFSRLFRQRYGQSPGTLRAKKRSA